MTRDEMLADLTYARTLAEEGRHAPLLGGSYLVFWGVLNAVAFAAQYAIHAGLLPLMEGLSFAVLWVGYGAVAATGMVVLRMRTRTKPGLTTIGARAERALWTGAAIALMAVVLGSIVRMFANGDPSAPNAILGAAFALYGAALFGTASLSEQTWLRGFGWLSVAVAANACMFADQNWVYIIASVGSLLALAWPGIILLRREPSAIV
ncbi:MAG: hypothetical protein AB7T59_18750 [Hyphomonadaceae bacterium]